MKAILKKKRPFSPSVRIRENMGQWKTVFSHILCNVWGMIHRWNLSQNATIITSSRHNPMRKIPEFHLIFWSGNFVERHRFIRVSGDLPKTLRKLCLSAKFPPQEIRWNLNILRSAWIWQKLNSETYLRTYQTSMIDLFL